MTTALETAALEVENLTVRAGKDGPPIVEGVSFTVDAGEILGIVGESGSGKTTLGLAVLGYGRDGATITGGDVRIAGHSVVHAKPGEIVRLRGAEVAYMPQDPGTSLNPARRIGAQLQEVLDLSTGRDRSVEPRQRLASAMEEVGLPGNPEFLRRYPHELSGGQQQRVLLALAFLRSPRVVVLDEPTTGLDVTTQARVLETVREVCHQRRSAAVYISHDLDVVASLATRVLVLYGGRIAEHGPSGELFSRPQHQYTGALLASAPELEGGRTLQGIPGRAPRLTEKTDGCLFAPRCPAADELCAVQPPPIEVSPGHDMYCHHPLGSREPAPNQDQRKRSSDAASASTLAARGLRAGYGTNLILDGVEFEVRRGECVAVVGESGSGKTTLSKTLSGLHAAAGGEITLDGRPLAAQARDRSVADRRAVQYVFQNPYGSLNPRKTVAALMQQPAKALGLDHVDAQQWLERVHLGRHVLQQRPRQLSGGERQRVAIARALTTQPTFLVCDEITSALDVSIQASVVKLLQELQEETGIGIVFVTHNLPLVAALADRIVVMQSGAIVEQDAAERLLQAPRTAYTKELLDAVPSRPGTEPEERPGADASTQRPTRVVVPEISSAARSAGR